MLLFVNFFIKRPVFTTVCTLIILLVGGISIPLLPIAQLPDIAPKQVIVTSNYIGADSKTVEDTVTTPLEREINGVQGMRYITSSSSNDGTSQIVVTFDASRDQDIAAVDVQNKVSVAEPTLPDTVRQTGINVEKSSNNLLIVFAVYPEDGEYDDLFISNYVDLFVLDAVKRVPGVGRAVIFGERKYAMRLWLDPSRLAGRNLTASDVANALREQNIQVGAGGIGRQPAPENLDYQISLRAQGRLRTVEEFEELVIARGDGGTLVKLKDVGRAELGAQDYSSSVKYSGKESVGLGIYQLPGTNALEVGNAVKAEIERLAQDFPPGMKTEVAYDSTQFVEVSLAEVRQTLFVAIALVVLIIFVFLQDWRTTLIPAIAIPVALIGTCAAMLVAGFSLNTLSLFGMILATGLVVDDAIVIVESISAKINNQGMKPRQAAMESMRELTGATIATSIVLMAVFIPVAFFPGTTGAIYRQFALTIAFAIAFSTFNALTFSPSMSGLLLQRQDSPPGGKFFGWFFQGFNRGFGWLQLRYKQLIEFIIKLNALVAVLFFVGLGLTAWMYQVVPTGFIPEEDQGYFVTIIQAPDGVSLSYTENVVNTIQEELSKIPEIEASFGVSGFGFDGSAPNKAIMFNLLKNWNERRNPDQSVYAILNRVNGTLFPRPEALILSVNAPPVQGLSNFGGFEFQMQNRSGGSLTLDNLIESAFGLMGRASQHPVLAGIFTQFSPSAPQMLIEVDRQKAKTLDVAIDDIFNSLQAYLGSQYVNDFTFGQRQYRVYIQAEKEFRDTLEDIDQIYVRSGQGDIVPLSNLVTITPTTAAPTINHYNLFQSININGAPKPGYSTGQAIQAMEEIFQEVAQPGLGYEWTGTALEELESGGQAPIIFGLGLVFVFLVLAAQYESYVDPTIIMITVPLAVLGALSGQWLRGLSNDVYCQVGLVMLIGLASKNAILIVEFANQARAEGLSIPKAALRAGSERFRPILMTAISTLAGFLPLVIATGAGASSRNSLGTAVFCGLLASTLLTLFIVPNLYIVIKYAQEWLFGSGKRDKHHPPQTPQTAPSGLKLLEKKPKQLNASNSKNGGNGQLKESNPQKDRTPESLPPTTKGSDQDNRTP